MNARTSPQAMDEATRVLIEDIAAQAMREAKRSIKEVSSRSEAVTAAGFGLCAIGNLLGADASEHHLDYDLKYGLANAVLALGELMKETGNRLWEICEDEQLPSPTQAKAKE